MGKFIRELKRRRVFRAAVSYLVVAWLIVQVISVVGPAIGLTERFMQYTLIALALGFPVSMTLSWFYSFSTHGIAREAGEDEDIELDDGRSLDFMVIGILAAALVASLLYIGTTKDSATPEAPEVNVLAVLPLTNISSTTPDNGFVEGLHHDLLGTLSQLSPLRVISRTSVLSFSNSQSTIGEIGAQLGADKIMEGSVQLAGEMIQISVRLIDVKSDSPLWSKTYKETFNARQLFSLQRDIALAVANELKVALSLQEDKRLESVPTQSTEAYRFYLLGQQRLAERTSTALTEALEYFQQAIDLDPQYAEAYAAMALTHNLQYSYSNVPLEDMLGKAMPLVQRALELNGELSNAHVVLADLRGYNNDSAGSEAAYKEAIRLNPNNTLARHWYGIMLLNEGRYQNALDQHLVAQKLDPLSPIITTNVAQDYIYLGDVDRALTEFEKTLEIKPDFVPVYAHMAALYGRSKRRPDEAVRWLRKAWELDPGHTEYPSQLAESLLDLGDGVNAGHWANIAYELGPDQYWPNRAKLLHALFIEDQESVKRHAETMLEIAPLQFHSTAIQVEEMIKNGDALTARRLFVPRFSKFLEQPPNIDASDYPWAVLFGRVLLATDERELADKILNAALVVMSKEPRAGFNGIDLLDVAALSLLGDNGGAVEHLADAKSSNWSTGWWMTRKFPLYESLWKLPELAAFEQDMAREMDALRQTLSGEERPPESSAP